MINSRKSQRFVLLILVGVMLVSFTGCARLLAPRTKLKHDVYSPEDVVSPTGQYVIGVRDELEVVVWRCPELDSKVVVRPEDGNVTIPLIGDVKADGRTPKQLAEAISEKLAHYVKEPRVAVGVMKFGEKKVYIMGQVRGPGAYQLDRSDRIMDIISRAGGFNDNAVPSAVWIVRGGYYNPETIRVNIGRLYYKSDTTQNVYLKEGDIVFVPVQGIENLNYALRKVFPSMFFAEKLADIQQDIMTGGWDWGNVFSKMSGDTSWKGR